MNSSFVWNMFYSHLWQGQSQGNREHYGHQHSVHLLSSYSNWSLLLLFPKLKNSLNFNHILNMILIPRKHIPKLLSLCHIGTPAKCVCSLSSCSSVVPIVFSSNLMYLLFWEIVLRPKITSVPSFNAFWHDQALLREKHLISSLGPTRMARETFTPSFTHFGVHMNL